jgi:ELWxxDGT repeat protein
MSNATTSSAPSDFVTLPSGGALFSAEQMDPVALVRTRQLWSTDGTEAGTQPVIADNTTVALDPKLLTPFGTQVLFAAKDEFGSRVLWVTDGTEANTLPLQTTTFASIVDPRDFTVFAGGSITSPFVIFTADDGEGGLTWL